MRDQEFSFGHAQIQVPIHWNGYVQETVIYMGLESRTNLCAWDINLGVTSIGTVFKVTGVTVKRGSMRTASC